MALPAGNILIVEDDRETRDLLIAMLSTEGFHVVGAEDGLEALHLLRTVRRRAPDVPCLVLLDLAMPRLSGKEFRRAQLADPIVASVPVAVMSGAIDLEQRAQRWARSPPSPNRLIGMRCWKSRAALWLDRHEPQSCRLARRFHMGGMW